MANILIIDDDPSICRLLTRTLSRAGHEVIEASDGREGAELFRAHRPQVVITDIVMPKQEGIETILELRRDAPTTPIIAISGGGQTQGMTYLDFASKLGADAVLSKPFRPTELVQLVSKILAGSSTSPDSLLSHAPLPASQPATADLSTAHRPR
jgi:DNA-binding response OmpR family regulator